MQRPTSVPLLPLLCLLALAGTPPAWAGLDLVPDVFDVSVQVSDVDPEEVEEGCAGGTTGRRLVRFALRIRNLGPDDLLVGEPSCPECPTSPGAICSNPLFFCSPAHGHAHFRSFVRAALLDRWGTVVAEGEKFGFCLLDNECATPQFTDCGYQGISAGCGDVYVAGLGCQYVDITDAGLDGDSYTLQVTIDPLDAIDETDEANNTVAVPVEFCGPAPSCPVYTANDVPLSLPDETTSASTITVPAAGPISRLSVVGLSGTHTFMSDLVVRLRGPDGTEVTLLNRVCGVDDDYSLGLDDHACEHVTCPPTDGGAHRPSEPLAAFEGRASGGPWTLSIADVAAGDDGTLTGWGLALCRCGDGVRSEGEECDDGNLLDGDGCSAACSAEPCGPAPQAGCRPAAADAASPLVMRNHPDDGRDRLRWKWGPGSSAVADFGTPSASTAYSVCLYHGSTAELVTGWTAPTAATCAAPPCWVESPTGALLRQSSAAAAPFRRIALRGSPKPGRATVLVDASGPSLGLPPLATLRSPLNVQLVNRESGVCWEALYSFPPAIRHDDVRFSDKAVP